MTWVQHCVDACFLLGERFKGVRCVEEVSRPHSCMAQLTSYAVSGYEINFYCHTKHYVCKYWRWWIPNRVFTTYRVYSVVSSDAPRVLREACELDMAVPAMAPAYVSQKTQKKFVLNAYLDVLIERLQLQDFAMTRNG